VHELFRKFSHTTSNAVGSPWAFMLAVGTIAVWAVTGPTFGYSDTWQLVINTGTTIITFLMVFLIQNTQNRDARAIHLKLDELLCAVTKARTGMVDLEELSDEELDRIHGEFQQIRKQRSERTPKPAAREAGARSGSKRKVT
jgi:low affinity Fe/Cu permease